MCFVLALIVCFTAHCYFNKSETSLWSVRVTWGGKPVGKHYKHGRETEFELIGIGTNSASASGQSGTQTARPALWSLDHAASFIVIVYRISSQEPKDDRKSSDPSLVYLFVCYEVLFVPDADIEQVNVRLR